MLLLHHVLGLDYGECLSVDEWPDAESFHTFFDEAGPEIGPLMEAMGVTSQPEVTVWRGVELGDAFGWGA